MNIPEMLFWISIALVAYTYLGYPLLAVLMGALFGRPAGARDLLPRVSVLIAVHNEERYIARKLWNLLEQDYPAERLEILVGSDGSTDRTDDIAAAFGGRVRFFRSGRRRGKVSVLNELVPRARGSIIVFADARQVFDRDAVRALVRNFADKTVGAACGEIILTGGVGSGTGKAICCYWAYEKFIRKAESAWYSLIGASGALYAIRRELYVPPPEDIILDDVYIPLQIARRGFRVLFDGGARAFDQAETSLRKETRRKVRTLTGNWQLFVRLWPLYIPCRGRVSLQLFSHKLMRLAAPFCLATALMVNSMLVDHPGYAYLFALHAVFYLLALGGAAVSLRQIRFFGYPYLFCSLHVDAVRGLYGYLRHTQKATWTK